MMVCIDGQRSAGRTAMARSTSARSHFGATQPGGHGRISPLDTAFIRL